MDRQCMELIAILYKLSENEYVLLYQVHPATLSFTNPWGTAKVAYALYKPRTLYCEVG